MWVCGCVEPTCAVAAVPRVQQGAGLLVLAFSLPLGVVGEGVYALVAAGVAVRVVDDHVVGGNRQVHAQLLARQAALSLREKTGRNSPVVILNDRTRATR